MDRECNSTRTIMKRYVIDDGWHIPEEIIADIDLKIELAWVYAVKEVERQKREHKGGWLTKEVADRYHQLARPFLAFHDGQYVETLRELGKELQEKYGVTELESVNILNGYNINDYVNRYYRMKNLIPDGFDPQEICDDTLYEYGYFKNTDEIAM